MAVLSNAEPLISVIIMAHNRKQYLKRAVDSALNQTLPRHKYEVIITKNFETEYDEEWQQKGAKLIYFDQAGTSLRVLDALQHCCGKIIAFLDDDDWWEPNKLEHVEEVWRKNPGTTYYHHSMIFEFEENMDNAWRREMIEFSREWKRIYPWHNDSSTLIAKQILLDNIDYLKNTTSAFDAFLFFAALVAGGKMFFDNAVLTHFRVPTMSNQSRADRRRKALLLIRNMVVQSKNRLLLKYFDQLVSARLMYWDCVEKIKRGQRITLHEFSRYMVHCLRFRPIRGGRRLLILAAGLVSPWLACKAYKGRNKPSL